MYIFIVVFIEFLVSFCTKIQTVRSNMFRSRIFLRSVFRGNLRESCNLKKYPIFVANKAIRFNKVIFSYLIVYSYFFI